MAITYGPCIYNTAVAYFLPLPIERFSVNLITRAETMVIPGVAGRSLIYQDREGFNITIAGQILGYSLSGEAYAINTRTAENAQNIKRSMEGYTDAGGDYVPSYLDGVFSVFRWKDRSYTNCRLVSLSFDETRVHSGRIPYTIEIASDDAAMDLQTTIADTNPWQAFIGRSAGLA